MKFCRRRLTAVVLSPLLVMATANAETLNLEQVIERSLNHDPRITEKEFLVEKARGLLQEAQDSDSSIYNFNLWVGIAPRVKGGFFEDNKSPVPVPRSDALDIGQISPWFNLQFTIVKPLLTFGKIENYEQAAEGNIRVQKQEVRQQRFKTVYDATRAYNGYLAARDGRLMLEDVIRRVEGAVELVEKWLKAGNGNAKQSDLYALQTALAIVQRYKAQAAALEAVALDGLKVLTGVGLGNDLQVADKGIRPVALPGEELTQLQKQALEQRPEVIMLEAGLEARRALVRANKAYLYPNLYTGFVGTFAYTPYRDALYNPHIFDWFNHSAVSPALGLKWDWESGVQPAKVVQAQAELDSLVATNSFAQQGIPFEVAEQYHQVQAHYEMVKRLTEGSKAGRRWMISSYADFEAGLETSDKVVTAFQGYVLAYSDYLQVVNDYNVMVTKLRQLTGVE